MSRLVRGGAEGLYAHESRRSATDKSFFLLLSARGVAVRKLQPHELPKNWPPDLLMLHLSLRGDPDEITVEKSLPARCMSTKSWEMPFWQVVQITTFHEYKTYSRILNCSMEQIKSRQQRVVISRFSASPDYRTAQCWILYVSYCRLANLILILILILGNLQCVYWVFHMG